MFEVGRPILKINKTVGGDQMILIGCVEEGDYWKSYFFEDQLGYKNGHLAARTRRKHI